MVKEIDKTTFDADVNEACVVDFYTSGCPICEKLSPLFDKVSDQGLSTKFFKVNLEDDMTLAERFNINHVPTTMLFRDGVPVETFVGFMDEDKLVEFIERKGLEV